MNRNVIIRVDDYPRALKEDERIGDSNRLDRLFCFDKIFKIFGIKYILGVVPSLINERDAELFKKLNIQIAMHGFDHSQNFHIKTKEDIRKDLLSGIKILNEFGIVTSDYISPFNEDSVDLKSVLLDLGFKRFFGGEIKEESQFSNYGDMECYQSPKKYYNIAEKIVIDKNDNNFIVTLHYTWEIAYLFGYNSKGLEDLLKVISKIIYEGEEK